MVSNSCFTHVFSDSKYDTELKFRTQNIKITNKNHCTLPLNMVTPVDRSVTLVGEKERRVLKDIIKHANTPVKSRVVPQGNFCAITFNI